MSEYVELHAKSAFSFLRGASLPGPLAESAAKLELEALAVLDHMGLYGAPRFASACREVGVRAIHGAELLLEDGSILPVLVENRAGYQNLCQLLTRVHLRSGKGEGMLRWDELPEFSSGLVALTGGVDGPLALEFLRSKRARSDSVRQVRVGECLDRLVQAFGAGNVYVEIQRHWRRGEDRLNDNAIRQAASKDLPLLATNGVGYATEGDREVADVFACLRHHRTLETAGALLDSNAQRHLKPAVLMKALFADRPEAVGNSVRLADRLRFELQDLGYEFPRYQVGNGETMEGVLREQTFRGASGRYPRGVPEKVRGLLEKELALINKLGFAGYFLVVADIVRFCRENDIMAQGRGSAANSAVCYCLGITAVDPVKFNVLFERFLSENRKGWPDIDIDLPSGDRRERVIQSVYQRYGPHGAAMTGTVITYRGRSTARELGKVLGLPADVLERFCNLFANGDFTETLELVSHMERAGLPPAHPQATAFASLYGRLRSLPRHLGQHSGGMIVCQGGLNRFVPLENAAMPGRVVAQWDKDDCEDLGLIKVDLLGLGMMSALQDCVTIAAERNRPIDLAQLPSDDPETFQLIQRADTIGLFQIESRAQMATLPRMKPRCFYDLVVEVALIRPGPIQGDLAHPYLRRRSGEEPVAYYAPQLVPVLERTLGVPLFQEQMLEMAMVMANFTGDEAEDLRRAMSFHRSEEKMRRAEARLRAAMDRSGVDPEISDRIVKAVGSFALYGFPESHAISFAHLAYASAYLKVHRTPEFYCSLLNNQPMGFYAPATLIRDAKRHGLRIKPVCVGESEWQCRVLPDDSLRLGLIQLKGLRRDSAEVMLGERRRRPFQSLEDFRRRNLFSRDELRTLAEVGALNCFGVDRRTALWRVERVPPADQLPGLGGQNDEGKSGETNKQESNSEAIFPKNAVGTTGSPLKPMGIWERIASDYSGQQLTVGPHPMALIRSQLRGVVRAEDLWNQPDKGRVRIAGQVICRQRPGTAKGICFVSLEDETGISNAIVASELFERERLLITTEPFLLIEGIVQSRHNVVHVKAERFEWIDVASAYNSGSHDFH